MLQCIKQSNNTQITDTYDLWSFTKNFIFYDKINNKTYSAVKNTKFWVNVVYFILHNDSTIKNTCENVQIGNTYYIQNKLLKQYSVIFKASVQALKIFHDEYKTGKKCNSFILFLKSPLTLLQLKRIQTR